MRLTGRSIGKVIARTVCLFVLGLFLQWVGMPQVATQPGTVYAQIAHGIGAGPPNGAIAKLPSQE